MDEYAAGRTPNPCLRCNEKIKFAAVLDRALALGFDAVATGHYAQLLAPATDGLVEMHRAVDHGKDQSYVLGRARPGASWRHSLFPLGDSTKADVRREAAERGLLVADKPDSHDICFVADGDNAGWLREKLGDRAPNQRRRHRRRRHRRGARPPRGHLRLHHRPAQGAADRHARPPTASRASCSTSSRSPAPSPSARASGSPCDRLSGIRPRWCGGRARTPAAPGHGAAARPRRRAPGPGRRSPDGRRLERRAARPGVRHRARAGGRGLRRHPGRRLGHDRATTAAAGEPAMTLATGVGSMPGEDAEACLREAVRHRARASCPTCRTCPSCPAAAPPPR